MMMNDFEKNPDLGYSLVDTMAVRGVQFVTSTTHNHVVFICLLRVTYGLVDNDEKVIKTFGSCSVATYLNPQYCFQP